MPLWSGPCSPRAAIWVFYVTPGSFVTEDQEREERGEPRWPELVLSAAG